MAFSVRNVYIACNPATLFWPATELFRYPTRMHEPNQRWLTKNFSLRSVLVVVAFVALLLSQIVTSVRLREAHQELDVLRRNYGYMKIEDDKKINVISLAQERASNGDALRFIIPPGERYFLHLSETTAKGNAQLPGGNHKTTVALNNWADGEDVILRYRKNINPVTQTPYLSVGSQNQGYFTDRPDDWPRDVSLSMVVQLDASEKLEIPPNEPIVLMRATSDEIDRGIILWLESETHRASREKL